MFFCCPKVFSRLANRKFDDWKLYKVDEYEPKVLGLVLLTGNRGEVEKTI